MQICDMKDITKTNAQNFYDHLRQSLPTCFSTLTIRPLLNPGINVQLMSIIITCDNSKITVSKFIHGAIKTVTDVPQFQQP